MNIRNVLIMVFTMLGFLSATASTQASAQNDDLDITAVKNQVLSVEKLLSKEQGKHQYTRFKDELSATIDSLKSCEKKSMNELAELNKIHFDSKVSDDEQVTQERTKEPDFKLLESKLQKRLFECKYWLLKTTQLRERTLKLLSKHQISDYFKSTPVYWGERLSSDSKRIITNLKMLVIFAIAYLIVQFSISYTIIVRKQWFGSGCYFIATLTTLVFASIASYYIKQNQVTSVAGDWLIWSSFIAPSTAIATKKSLPIFYSTAAIFLSFMLLEPEVWQIHYALHLLFIVLFISVLYLIEKFGASFGFGVTYKLALVVIGMIEIADYHTLSHQLLLLVFILHIFFRLHFVIKESLNSLSEYIYASKIKSLVNFREFLKITKKHQISGLEWLKWTLYFSVMIKAILSLIGYSGISEVFAEAVRTGFSEGFEIGTIRINLQNILVASFVLGFLTIIASVIRRKIESSYTKADSAQQAKGALFWYAAMLTSFLTALSISGFSVQNLALIAGAFSVGIGFGLQNIVSNFVSGIILLIERPVKPGDWVIIGGTEGFIQNISIRATQIRTFDKSDILIPNTEFISNQVTNLTLGDNVGRLRFTVGVAYGSDTEKVQKILSRIVTQHPEVINDDETYKPTIVFRQFGDSSLEFEIRCFLRDIRNIIIVRSEIHFEIDKQFRLENVEIPFPQRDLHIRSDDTKKQ